MSLAPIDGAELDIQRLNHELDKTKAQVFMGECANFFGALMCYQNFIWTKEVPTAAVDGVNFYWNPDFFDAMPPETRKSIVMHELWHIARLDMVRRGSRNAKIWNYACDISINNDLIANGYTFEKFSPWKDPAYTGMATEDIYDDLVKRDLDWASIIGDLADMLEPTEEQKQAQVETVAQSAHVATMTGGDLPGDVEKILKQFLAPVIPWEAALWRWFTDLQESDYTWQTRDRRYPEVYLPGELEDDGRLDHLAYFSDTSASMSEAFLIRINSEVKHIKDSFHPKKLTFVQFDTIIQDVQVFKEEDRFEEILVRGRGGTCLRCVHQWIVENKPTAVIIFTDLGVSPMEPLPVDIPVLWIGMGDYHAEVPFGDIIRIKG